jgi:hypothetical protein
MVFCAANTSAHTPTQQLVDERTTVADARRHAEREFGVPAAQQALSIAGMELPPPPPACTDGGDGGTSGDGGGTAEHAAQRLLAEPLRLDAYAQRGEVMITLERRLAAPRRVWLMRAPGCNGVGSGSVGKNVNVDPSSPDSSDSCSSGGPDSHLEVVEAAATMRDVAALLTAKGLADAALWGAGGGGGSAGNSSSDVNNITVVVRRADGSAPRRLDAKSGTVVAELEGLIAAAEGAPPAALAFWQAGDGCLIAVFTAGEDGGGDGSALPRGSKSLSQTTTSGSAPLPPPAMRARGVAAPLPKKQPGRGQETVGALARRLGVAL